MSTDYHDLQYLETVNHPGNMQTEKYREGKPQDSESYTVMIRQERFGPIQAEANHLHEGDANQLLEASKNGTNIHEILNGGEHLE